MRSAEVNLTPFSDQSSLSGGDFTVKSETDSVPGSEPGPDFLEANIFAVFLIAVMSQTERSGGAVRAARTPRGAGARDRHHESARHHRGTVPRRSSGTAIRLRFSGPDLQRFIGVPIPFRILGNGARGTAQPPRERTAMTPPRPSRPSRPSRLQGELAGMTSG